jgi:hypothetical protein
MNITLFTSTQPRHLFLIETLANIADELYVVQETNTVFPGQSPGIFRNSSTMKTYFDQVNAAEHGIFGRPRFAPSGAHQLVVQRDDLNLMDPELLGPAWDSDYFIVFGSSYIKKPLIDLLIAHRSINIHMGVSPYFRGNSCNFWALYDNRPDLVGATIHMLSAGLDSGGILFHALPQAQAVSPFQLGMLSVRSAHLAVSQKIASGTLFNGEASLQDTSGELRYSRSSEFTDEIAQEYMDRPWDPKAVKARLDERDLGLFVEPVVI